MRFFPAWTCALLLISSVADAGSARVEREQRMLKGAWIADYQGKKIELSFDKEAFTITFSFGKDKFDFQGTYTVDPSKKPKQMDMKVTKGPNGLEGKTALAVYDLDGETLKWYANEPGKDDRPSAFPDKEGDNGSQIYLQFKRAK
jgi:uncharacterized protein (TIGR03067 family)